ncbi:MAG: DUF2202 domain-containing protein [Chlorobi bacterium]|nr:DUF2202 domain-containing protein [Chlorobiota bacterium]
MKNAKKKISFSLIALIAILFISVSSCNNDEENITSDLALTAQSKAADAINAGNDSKSIFAAAHSDTIGIKHMREEEKLARDVYDYMYVKWNTITFDNISNSEQVHMDRMLDLVNLFNIDDPALPEPREFVDQGLQDLYDNLIAIGDNSLIDALIVGATIEEVDILDLHEYTNATDNENIKCVYGNLTKGSRNHLRSYYHKLEGMGVTYTPQFLTEEEFYSIVDTPHEIGGTPCDF